ncbi:hypothetical protein IFM89_022954 [Coptis chinensis]|uniref:Uncharacterized protein n=1 Tax=Coptis chinensis TaxID=261450 RepID=A0A835HLG6_9MAGN|nr:hypothetical protein IFM89_022954 [Coptis chinensis]
MSSCHATQKLSHHARSISLPSDPHPLALQVEKQLCGLRAAEIAASSSSSICHNLASLQDLYECVDSLLHLPLAQQSLSFERHEQWVDRVCDGSLELLDICGTTRDTLSESKQSLQDLQSSVRRKVTESELTNEVCAYIMSRKKGSKVIQKCVQDMKKMDCKFASFPKDNNMVTILREVETITLAVLKSLLPYLSGASSRSKQGNNHSLVFKLKLVRSTSCKEKRENIGQVVTVDAVLKTLRSQKSCKSVNIENVQKSLQELEMSIQDLEDGLEGLFRSIIKTRVALLNILNQ